MAPVSRLLLGFLSLFSLVSSHVIIPWLSGGPVPPLQDLFYCPPIGYEKTSKPGDILRYRTPPFPLAAFATVPLNLESSFQILYRTTDSHGFPQATVSTILVPKNANYSRLVSYQDIENAAYLNCATSFALQLGVGSNTTLSQLSVLFIAGFLELGYVVSVPDFEGPSSSFGAGIQAGQAVLDSIRAALKSSSFTKIATSNVDIALWGYSAGSIGTEWAAELQPSYAPELWIKGAITGGVISNLSQTILTLNNGAGAGLGVAGVLGLISAYPQYYPFFNNELISATASTFKQGSLQCATQNIAQFAYQNIGNYFKHGVGALSLPETVAVITAAGVMGLHGLPTIPLYIFNAVGDEVNPITDVDRLVTQYCAEKISSLTYVRNLAGDHFSEAFTGAGGALAFLQSIFNGCPPPSGCNIEHVYVTALDPLIVESFGVQIAADMAALWGLPLGPSCWAGWK